MEGGADNWTTSVHQADDTEERESPSQALFPSSRTLPWGSSATTVRILLLGGLWARGAPDGAPDSLTPTLSGLAGLPRASGLRVQM